MKLKAHFLSIVLLSLLISAVSIGYAHYLSTETERARLNLTLNEQISRDISKINISILDPNVQLDAVRVDRTVEIVGAMLANAGLEKDYALVRHLSAAKATAYDLKDVKSAAVRQSLVSQLRLRLLEAQTAALVLVSKWHHKYQTAYNNLYLSNICVSALFVLIIGFNSAYIFFFAVKPIEQFSSSIRDHTVGTKLKFKRSSKINEIENLIGSFEQMDGKLADAFQILKKSEMDLKMALTEAEAAKLAKEETETSLRRAQRMEAVGQLTGGIAHDFNNLLGVMIGNAEMLGDVVGVSGKAHLNVDAIINAANRGASLTQRLLAFSRQQPLSPRPTAINGLVVGLEDIFRRTLGEFIDLQLQFGAGVHDALIDPHQFESALFNLAINARDAMPEGGVLTIDTSNTTLDEAYAAQREEVTAGEYVKVAVSDTGTGMTHDILEKVYEPFFTTKEVGKGSGLGLSMVYGFAKQSNGHITIDSIVGQGTTVCLYMPQSRATAPQDIKKDVSPIPQAGHERILVVEDDESLREVPVSILRQEGYDVFEAKDGHEALKQLMNAEPLDLLFTDVVLPGGMNGTDIAHEAIRIQPSIKILFTSGYAENSVVHRGKLVPGMTLLNKPYRRAELLEKIRTALNKKAT